MKHKLLLLLIAPALVLLGKTGSAQPVTITTAGTGYTGTNGAGAGYAITFVVENLSGNDILLTDVGNFWNSGESGLAELWYSTTSLSGSYGTLATPTWNLIASNNVTVAATGITQAFSNLTFLIPNGAQYRFALNSYGYCRYSGTGAGTCTPNTFTANGVTLKVGDVQISGSYIGYGATNNPRFFTGYITFINACALPQNIGVSNITVNSADIQWTPPGGSAGSEYILDQNPGNPSGAGTTTSVAIYHASGLSANTIYYFHLRNQCNSTSYSSWTTSAFTTANAYCIPPTNILYSNLTSNSVDLLWSLMPTASHYDYKVDQQIADPAYGNYTSTTAISAKIIGLMPDTKYYTHVRSVCLNGNDSSVWRLDSFVTKNYCGAPDVHVNGTGTIAPSAWWYKVPFAVSYEYKVTSLQSPPSYGTEISDTVVYLSLPAGNTGQYLHVRTKCNSQFSFSDWTTTTLRNPVEAVNNMGYSEAGFSVYPNPVKDVLNIAAGDEGAYILTNITGSVVANGDLHRNTQVDFVQLPAGAYLLKCITNKGTAVVRVIKE